MKRSIRFSLLLAGVCAVLPVAGLRAQGTAAPAPTPSVSAPAADDSVGDDRQGGPGVGRGNMHGGKGHGGQMLASLTPEERQKVMAARKKAMQDPAVQQARANRQSDPKAFRQAMRAAVLRADPEVKEIMAKARENNRLHKKDLQTN